MKSSVLYHKTISYLVLIKNNKKVVENYFFMTVLQLLNSFFYLLIYPYLIRVLGSENYGAFVFATSLASYFLFFLNFGFDLPATKFVAENNGRKTDLSKVLSSIFTAKSILFLISLTIFIVSVFVNDFLNRHKELYLVVFLSIYSYVLFPQWFFQGIQNMKIVTSIQLITKIMSLPFIFTLVKNSNDIINYAYITTITNLVAAFIAYLIIHFKYDLRIGFESINSLKPWFKESQAFFYSNLAATIKEYTIPIIIGGFFGMKEVALYDLANKIIVVPRTLILSINAAIFPKLITNINNQVVKRLILAEFVLSLLIIFLILIFGRWAVTLLGGVEMIGAYSLAVLMSVTIVSWLVVGAFIYFVFIPNNKSYLVTINQVIALFSFFGMCLTGLFLYNNINIFGAALAVSGILEILFCIYITKKYRLL